MSIKRIKADLPREIYKDFPEGTINWREVEADPIAHGPGTPGFWPGIRGNVETQQIIRRDTCGSEKTVMGRSVYHPGDYHQPHMHYYAEEIMYCISGRGVVGAGDKEYILCAGDVQFNKIGTVHWLRNPFDEPCEFIWIYSGCSMPLESGYATCEWFDEGMKIFNEAAPVK